MADRSAASAHLPTHFPTLPDNTRPYSPCPALPCSSPQTLNLQALQDACPNAPWSLTFSYGRALQSTTLKVRHAGLALDSCQHARGRRFDCLVGCTGTQPGRWLCQLFPHHRAALLHPPPCRRGRARRPTGTRRRRSWSSWLPPTARRSWASTRAPTPCRVAAASCRRCARVARASRASACAAAAWLPSDLGGSLSAKFHGVLRCCKHTPRPSVSEPQRFCAQPEECIQRLARISSNAQSPCNCRAVLNAIDRLSAFHLQYLAIPSASCPFTAQRHNELDEHLTSRMEPDLHPGAGFERSMAFQASQFRLEQRVARRLEPGMCGGRGAACRPMSTPMQTPPPPTRTSPQAAVPCQPACARRPPAGGKPLPLHQPPVDSHGGRVAPHTRPGTRPGHRQRRRAMRSSQPPHPAAAPPPAPAALAVSAAVSGAGAAVRRRPTPSAAAVRQAARRRSSRSSSRKRPRANHSPKLRRVPGTSRAAAAAVVANA